MSMKETMKSRGIAVFTAALMAALISGMPVPLRAQEQARSAATVSAKVTAAPTGEEENTEPAKPGHDGITVHGHWIMDVKDKDGRVVEHRDFHNSLTQGGSQLLVGLLTGQVTPNVLGIAVTDTTGVSSVLVPATTSSVVPNTVICSANSTNCIRNLVTSILTDSSGGFSIKLAGQVTPSAAILYQSVGTIVSVCVANGTTPAAPIYVNIGPTACAANNLNGTNASVGGAFFSATTLSTPLAVAAGQSVSVSVTLSFT